MSSDRVKQIEDMKERERNPSPGESDYLKRMAEEGVSRPVTSDDVKLRNSGPALTEEVE